MEETTHLTCLSTCLSRVQKRGSKLLFESLCELLTQVFRTEKSKQFTANNMTGTGVEKKNRPLIIWGWGRGVKHKKKTIGDSQKWKFYH